MALIDEHVNEAVLKNLDRKENFTLFGLTAPYLLLVFFLIIIPVGWLFYMSFIGRDGSYSIENYERMLKSKSYIRIFIIPFWTSLLVRTYAWLVLLQRKGLINNIAIDLGFISEPIKFVHNTSGTLIGMAHIMLPFLILPLYANMRAIDKDCLKAAANLGATPTRAFWTVFFPLSIPGLLAGLLIVFVICLGFYVTPAVLGGGKVIMAAMKISSNIELYFSWGAASALGVVLLVVTMLILYIASKLVSMDQIGANK